jgi:hypothetical protein
MTKLLIRAAECFSDGYSPFNSEWLSKNKVTLDECSDLSNLIGLVALGFARATKRAQDEIMLAGASDFSPEMIRAIVDEREAKKKLGVP